MVVMDTREGHCCMHSTRLSLTDIKRPVKKEDPRLYQIFFGACPLDSCQRVHVFYDEYPDKRGGSYDTTKAEVGRIILS